MILIYTDLLLDDLCALEVLGKWCNERKEKAFIVGTCLKELHHSEYGSKKVRTLKDSKQFLDRWFERCELVSEKSSKPRTNPSMIIVLCPVTAFVADMERKVTDIPDACECYVMGGTEIAEDHMKGEYNASCDRDSFSKLLGRNIAKFFTMERCLDLFKKYEYETDVLGKKPEFLDEYCEQMKRMNESLYCPDLMVANDIYKRNGKNCISFIDEV